MSSVRPARAAVERLRVPYGVVSHDVVSSDGAAGRGEQGEPRGRVDRNVWFVGDTIECAVVDPAGPVTDLLYRCGDRRIRAIVWTGVWPDSVRTAIALADRTGAVTYLHTDDLAIWRKAEPERRPQSSVPRGLVLSVGGLRLESIATPGLTAGALCWYVPAHSAVFSGQTLGADGPGGADLSRAQRSTLMASIRTGLFSLPSQTVVHPGEGEDTRIGTQRWDHRFWS